MKIFFVVISFLMLYVSCLPCRDSRECNALADTKVSAIDSHQQHQHSQKVCTPFCTCSCCGASAFYSPLNKIQIARISFQSKKYPLHNENFNTEVFYSIWQPPKLS